MDVPAPHGCVIWQHCCSVGQQVREGDDIISIEAMKMETLVQAPCSGVIEWLKPMGEQAEEGESIATIKED